MCSSTKELQEREDILLGLRRKYEDLLSKFSEDESSAHTAAIGSSANLLFPPSSTGNRSAMPYDEAEARDALMGNRTSPASMRKSVRFSENLVDTQELDNTQVLQLHRRIMDEQDDSLDRLSESISRQRELSIQIGDELDSHVQLLDEVDDLVDRHQTRLDGAGQRLKSVAKQAKEHGERGSQGKGLTHLANTIYRELGCYYCFNNHFGLIDCNIEIDHKLCMWPCPI